MYRHIRHESGCYQKWLTLDAQRMAVLLALSVDDTEIFAAHLLTVCDRRRLAVAFLTRNSMRDGLIDLERRETGGDKRCMFSLLNCSRWNTTESPRFI